MQQPTVFIAGYEIVERPYRGRNSLVYPALSSRDARRVMLKMAAAAPTPHDLVRLRREFDLTRTVEHPNVVRSLELLPWQNGFVLVTEAAPGLSLREMLATRQDDLPFSMPDALRIALGIADALIAVHAAGIVHKDITPANIIVQPSTFAIHLIDFGLASHLPRESLATRNPDALEGTLAYLAPEQTGRMNRAVDYRADLYGLGAVCYEMLTGSPPFSALDPLELIHCHIAQEPKSPASVNPAVPAALSQLVMRLLAKNPDERYQSAHGVRADLERCLNFPEDNFVLGQQDMSVHFHLPEGLYGREREVKQLIRAFEATTTRPRLMLVAGYAGTGKSRLVGELQEPILRRRGYFVSGKFDLLKRDVPFASLHAALGDLVRQVLTEDDAAIAEWRLRLQDALEPNGRLITDVIPELEKVIGEQPPVEALPPRESQNRFQRVFRSFVQVFCRPEHPVCLFLDDLQWSDSATLQWLEEALQDDGLGALLIIGAYRDNEVSPAHPLSLTLNRLEAEFAEFIERLTLEALDPGAVTQFVADALHVSDIEQARPLANLLVERTQGNPFFVNQFLLTLYETNILHTNLTRRCWSTDIEKASELAVTDNVVDLLLGRIRRLGDDGQRLLPVAACIGNTFTRELLARAADVGEPELLEAPLAEAVRMGLLVAAAGDDEGREYRFRHDRVLQAAATLLDSDKQQIVHLRLGRLLAETACSPGTDDRLFEALSHFLAAETLLTDPAEREATGALHLAAAERARRATAYTQALRHAEAASRLISLTAAASLRFNLLLERAQCEHLAGNDTAAESFFSQAQEAAPDVQSRGRVYENEAHFWTNRADFPKAYAAGRAGAALFGVKLPEAFVPPLLMRDLAQIKMRMRSTPIASLVDAPAMQDADGRNGARLATAALKAAYQIKPQLCIAGSAALLNLCLQKGNFDDCAVAFLPVGPIFHAGVLGHHTTGYDWGQACLALQEKFTNRKQRAEVHFVYAYFAHSWLKPLRTTDEHFRIAYQAGVDSGDFFHAGCACSGLTQNMLLRGASQDVILAECERFLPFLEQIGARENQGTVLAVRQAVRCLRGETESRLSLSDADFNEPDFVATLSEYGSKHFAHYYWVNKLQTLFLWREYEAAVKVAETSATYLGESLGMQHAVEHHFYTALLYADLYATKAPGPKGRWRTTVQRTAAKFRRWASRCPENFAHKASLIAAEYARISGRFTRAAPLYDAAIEQAAAQGFVQNEALACELAARFYAQAGQVRLARLYLHEAVAAYRRWGADALADTLPARYAEQIPFLLAEFQDGRQEPITRGATIAGRTQARSSGSEDRFDADLQTVLRAAESIAGEVQLSSLLKRLLQLVMANAGASRALLLLPQGGDYLVQAEGTKDQVTVLQAMPLADQPQLARTVISYVLRSRETVTLNDVSKPGRFGQDAYLQGEERPRSLLCAPLLNRGALQGVLYLENRLVEGAFTREREELLLLLSAQFTISIENALAYSVLERRVRERTEQLEARNELIRRIFGRYMSEDIVDRLLEEPTGLTMGGEYRTVTVLTADLRGFTVLTSALRPGQVVQMVNLYLEIMVNIVQGYGGTISDFTGDGFVVFFGAPSQMPDHAARGVACAVALQLAMRTVNERCRDADLPSTLAMGIGLCTGEVVAGNIGSMKRAKYSVMGMAINLATRIESYTTGGQILIADSTRQLAGDLVEVRSEMEIEPKGSGRIRIYEVAGVGAPYDLHLESSYIAPRPLPLPITAAILRLVNKNAQGDEIAGTIVAASATDALLLVAEETTLPVLTDVRFRVCGSDGKWASAVGFAKVTQVRGRDIALRFTMLSEEIRTILRDAATENTRDVYLS